MVVSDSDDNDILADIAGPSHRRGSSRRGASNQRLNSCSNLHPNRRARKRPVRHCNPVSNRNATARIVAQARPQPTENVGELK